MHGKDDLETYVSMGSWIGGPVSLLPSWKKIVGSVIGQLLAVRYLGRVDDEVTEGESEAIVFPLNPDLWRLNHVRIPKLIARKLSESHFQF